MRSRLYNFGDSWAWGYNDNFETYKTTYAGIIAKTLITKSRCMFTRLGDG